MNKNSGEKKYFLGVEWQDEGIRGSNNTFLGILYRLVALLVGIPLLTGMQRFSNYT